MRALAAEVKPSTITMGITTAISIAVLYCLICLATPSLSCTVLGITPSFRIANALKSLLFISPYAAAGSALGAWMYNIITGKVAIGAYSVIGLIHVGLGVLFYNITEKVGRSTMKDIVVLLVFAILSSLITISNISLLAALTGNVMALKLVVGKLLSDVAIILSGYVLFSSIGIIKISEK
ncbi:hypothetical protein [Geobacter sp. SVR]|uniref:hypothetical protein n=1 Tax=Geobacter sp. SVR TaxID=2495594 RepID=UPI00143F0324|nr:hypothetical protein [Geobacter sp. SVR]BCS54066.1 hypothetical protein GSVR_23740 [Geobacter sp. SVR]GCF87549.1 hypothetical protein GSbR_41490 [Geobacter sp. SVR]